jgi:hypothetical protein
MIEPRYTVIVTRATSACETVTEHRTCRSEHDARAFIAEEIEWESTLWAECEALDICERGAFNFTGRIGSAA